MSASEVSRRRFLATGACSGAALLGLGELPWLRRLGAVSAEEARVPGDIVQFRPEIEPLVRLLEETPRERLLEEVAQRTRAGLGYREVLAAIMLAGVRNVHPGPIAGGKLHIAMVVNSAHMASLASPPADRWLPVFWAIDHFKVAQAWDVEDGDWTMPALSDSKLPPSHRAAQAFADAMESWDPEAADRAMAAWVRSASVEEIYDKLWFYGARDYLHIGHKAIYCANSYRTLQVIGTEHAEGVLRSLARCLVICQGGRKPSSDFRTLRPMQFNQRYVTQLRPGWQHGRDDAGATVDLLATLREGTSENASAKVVELVNRGVALQSIWDGFFTAAAEQIMRHPNIFSLHAQTHTNAMRFAFHTTQDDATRRFLLLQNAAYLAMFRHDSVRRRPTGFTRPEMAAAGSLVEERIDQLRPDDVTATAKGAPTVEKIFADLGHDRRRATLGLLASLEHGTRAESVIDAARLLVFLKGDDTHDYKYSSAIIEDYGHVSPVWRNRFLAANLSLLRSSSASPDNPLTERIRHLFAA
ncbi:MAG: hypothetical protein AAF657_09105 [Acidobacteriota bacterium]